MRLWNEQKADCSGRAAPEVACGVRAVHVKSLLLRFQPFAWPVLIFALRWCFMSAVSALCYCGLFSSLDCFPAGVKCALLPDGSCWLALMVFVGNKHSSEPTALTTQLRFPTALGYAFQIPKPVTQLNWALRAPLHTYYRKKKPPLVFFSIFFFFGWDNLVDRKLWGFKERVLVWLVGWGVASNT